MAVFHELERFGGDIAHVGHVPMADVRAEDGAQARPQRVLARVERPGVDRVVGLAAEIEIGNEALAHVLQRVDAAARELIEHRRIFHRGPDGIAGADVEREVARGLVVGAARHQLAAVLPVQLPEAFPVEVVGIEVLDGVAIAFLPVADEVAVEAAAPAHAALEEGHAQ